jgi:pilus assembly protein CpaE
MKTDLDNFSLLCLSQSDDIRQKLSELAAITPNLRLESAHGELEQLNAEIVEKVREADVILVEVGSGDPAELAQLRSIVQTANGKSAILATAKDVGAHTARELIRNDVNDFLPQPFSVDELTEAIGTVQNRRFNDRAETPGGEVIVVARAKGGMGATTTAIHIAQSLATSKRRRKEPAARVCFLDLDVQFGDASNFLDLQPRQALIDIADDPDRLDMVLFESFLQEHEKGIWVLTSPSDAMPLDALQPESVDQLITLAQRSFDYVVIDLPLAFPEWLGPVFHKLSSLILVTQMNVPAVLQTRRYLEIIKDEGLYNLPVKIILNRYAWRLKDASLKKKCISALNEKIFHTLPSDYALTTAAANQGASIFSLKNRSSLAKSIRKMSAKLADDLATKSSATTAHSTA